MGAELDQRAHGELGKGCLRTTTAAFGHLGVDLHGVKQVPLPTVDADQAQPGEKTRWMPLLTG
ncbi:MAG: hypothetical protein IPK32_13880 [Verrucomicrobiaceae bacterium]|nr:hypothetical protein [Verrucomicrobiaceae bacterium]MBK8093038.1 hypothetical protein [Verrucomicrobiaceae bacterium]